MTGEADRFNSTGPSWAERAGLGGLRAVIGPNSSDRENSFLHGIQMYAARRTDRRIPDHGSLVDFGCGNGRFTRFFGARGHRVLGTEITSEMIDSARVDTTDPACSFALTDGIAIPADDASVDAIWICGVLRFSIFVPEPVLDKIAAEMMRVLRPGGLVVNVEMFLDQDPKVFVDEFVAAGFSKRAVRVLHRYGARLEHYMRHPRIPSRILPWLGARCAQLRYHLDWPERVTGLSDYYFEFQKPSP